jgi:hypothetical protein
MLVSKKKHYRGGEMENVPPLRKDFNPPLNHNQQNTNPESVPYSRADRLV